MDIDFGKIEKKWQKAWAKEKIFCTQGVPSASGKVSEDSEKEPFYVLEMFPYPSGAGLHMGHALNYTIGDILARFKIMKGFNVLHPMGFDALGLPAENAAIKAGTHPEDYTNAAIENFVKQDNALGVSYDWSRMVNTASPDYYRWDQWIFLKMLEKGLAYQKESAVNWCPLCDTVLANEQVNEGKCWRHEETDVEVRKLRQWFFRTTDYAQELLDDLKKIDWPHRTKKMQENWIGRSEGTEISFEVSGWKSEVGSRKSREDLGNVVIVHGANAKDKENIKKYNLSPVNERDWLAWTKLKLEEQGIKTTVPLMPEMWAPKYKDWKKEFEKIDIDKNSILVGTSAGGAFLTRWLGETNIKIKKLILIAPAIVNKQKEDWTLEEFYNFEINKNILNKVSKIVLIESSDDYGSMKESAKIYSKELNIKSLVLENRGHFTHRGNGENKDFPELLDEILATDFTDSHGHDEGPQLDSLRHRTGQSVWKVFTTRPDTVFGVTFMVVAAGHDRLDELVTESERESVDLYLKKMNSVSEKDIERGVKEGVFSGSYAVNPANGERVPIWVGNFVLADYGSGMVMGVPAHDKRDFEFAVKYGIEVRQVVAPFIRKNVDEDKETKERCTVLGIVKNTKTGKILCLDWKKTGWKAFPAGGVDEGEDVVDAVKREILEETGYKNLKFVRKIGGELYQNFYRPHKGNNIYCKNEAYYFELIDEERDEVDASELEKHEAVWIKEDKVKAFVNVFGPEVVWDWYLNGNSAFTGEGVLCNSGEFDRMDSIEAKEKIRKFLGAKKVVNFKLRDWGISRQRYWGTPIPIVYCDECGAVPVPEKDLPVVLPKDVKFGKGNPLETNEDWLNAKCPKCGKMGRRESDTMDTFVNSSWYFLRYCDSGNSKKIFDKKKVEYWSPVDVYVGGAEHACMHLLYARFYTKFLRDIGMLDFDEPFLKLFHQGMLRAEDGRKMSKSLGNVVEPIETMAKYGVDATRWFLISVASPDKDFDWSEKGIAGSVRFVKKVVGFYDSFKEGEDSDELLGKLNLTLENLENYYGNFMYRKATIEIRELFGLMSSRDDSGELKGCSKDVAMKFLKMIAPICPHVAEELWSKIGGEGFISTSVWPEVDSLGDIVLEKITTEDFSEKIISQIEKIIHDGIEKVFIYVMPFELESINLAKIGEKIGKVVEVFAVNDSGKHDPKGMAKKAKPGKASIYLE